MDKIIAGFIENGFILSGVMTLILIIKMVVDYWNTTNLERLLMTDMQKFKGSMSNLLLSSLPLAALGALLIRFVGNNAIGTEDASSYDLNFVTWGSFVLILVSLAIFNAILLFIEWLFLVKLDYYIKLEDDRDWKVIRRSTNDLILVKNEISESKFLDDWVDKVFISEPNENSNINSFYLKPRKPIYFIVFLSLLSIILGIVSIYYNNNPWSFLTAVIAIFSLLSAILIFANRRDLIKIKQQQIPNQ